MNAVILNGSKDNDTVLDKVQQTIIDELACKSWEIEPLNLHKMDIKPCAGCFGCWVRTPGICIINDEGRDIARKIIQSDLVIYLTPVTFGGYSSHLKKVLDRSISLILPFFKKIDGEVHHQARYEHYPRLIGVGVLPKADEESERIFTTLVSRNGINMHTPVSTAGIVYRNHKESDIHNIIQTLLSKVEVN